VKKKMKIYREEIFGPVLAVSRAASYDEAANLITDTNPPTARPSSQETVMPQESSRTRFKPAWSALTCLSPF
jgi:Aldehyde dehydrogenase family